ncbi:MAG: DUF2207 family protein [Candidatus Cryptobacteroides sp.]
MRLHAALTCAFLLSFGTLLSAQSVVDSLRIDVSLMDDGSAHVTEYWSIDVRGDITEWYLVEGNLGRMEIRDLEVSDEHGVSYVSEGRSWDVDRSRREKAGRCGIVPKSDGCELCWGVGSDGPHKYRVSYLLTGLVRSYTDADGFNHMFVSRGHSSPPREVSLTIRKPGQAFTSDNVSIWGFGFNGEIQLADGVVKAKSSGQFSRQSALIAMLRFGKGIFSPTIAEDRSFEEVRQAAMKGSDYREKDSDTWIMIAFAAFFILIIGLVFILAIWHWIRTNRRKKALLGGVPSRKVGWFRDVPVGGDLKKAYGIFNAFENSVKAKERLIGAYLARLFYKGAISIVPQDKGKPAFRINEYPDTKEDSSSDAGLEKRLYDFLREASGNDSILQQKELRRWASSHSEELYRWQESVGDPASVWSMDASDVRQVFGLRNFLRDFTLISDRGVVEVKLWNEYLIFATLFGIADQVYKDFRKVCPEYFELAKDQFGQEELSPVIIWSTIGNSSNWMNQSAMDYASHLSDSQTRWSGGGGMTSFGGGGGFSGGGFGGGGR